MTEEFLSNIILPPWRTRRPVLLRLFRRGHFSPFYSPNLFGARFWRKAEWEMSETGQMRKLTIKTVQWLVQDHPSNLVFCLACFTLMGAHIILIWFLGLLPKFKYNTSQQSQTEHTKTVLVQVVRVFEKKSLSLKLFVVKLPTPHNNPRATRCVSNTPDHFWTPPTASCRCPFHNKREVNMFKRKNNFTNSTATRKRYSSF